MLKKAEYRTQVCNDVNQMVYLIQYHKIILME